MNREIYAKKNKQGKGHCRPKAHAYWCQKSLSVFIKHIMFCILREQPSAAVVHLFIAEGKKIRALYVNS